MSPSRAPLSFSCFLFSLGFSVLATDSVGGGGAGGGGGGGGGMMSLKEKGEASIIILAFILPSLSLILSHYPFPLLALISSEYQATIPYRGGVLATVVLLPNEEHSLIRYT